MKIAALSALVAGTMLLASPAAADVRLTIGNGHVTLSANNATIRQILAEWAKVGQTKIVNGDRVPGGPVTLELTNVYEAQALEIILRSVGGYLLAPRPVATPNTSQYDRILIVPTSSGTPARPNPTPIAAPAFLPPNGGVPGRRLEDEPEEVPEPPTPPNVTPTARPPVFNTFPQPPAAPPPPPEPTAPTPGSTPSMPVGVSTPGMVVPPPQQQPPGQPAPGTPPQ
jgi:hypothetical protein